MPGRNLISSPNRTETDQQNNRDRRHRENESKVIFSHAHSFLPRRPNEVKSMARVHFDVPKKNIKKNCRIFEKHVQNFHPKAPCIEGNALSQPS
jgi:hypothetical protein